jgi:hypothetical protein
VKQADVSVNHHSEAVVTGMRLLDQAATADRVVSYRALQVISWQATGESGTWLSRAPVMVTVSVQHSTGQPADGVLGLTPALVGLLRTHYAVMYTGLGSAAGRPASIVEVLRSDGSIAAQFWLDQATKLPLRRELFDTRAHVVSVSDLVGLTVATPAATRSRRTSHTRTQRPPTAKPPQTAKRKASGTTLTAAQRDDIARVIAHFSDAAAMDGTTEAPLTTATPMSGTNNTTTTNTNTTTTSTTSTATANTDNTNNTSTGMSSTGAGSGQTGAEQANQPAHAGASSSQTTASGVAATSVPWNDHLGAAQLAVLRQQGWPALAAMPGGLTLFGASESVTTTGRVVDLAYSDGLSVVSLFVQRGQLPAALPGWRTTDLSGHPLFLRDPAEPDVTWSAGGYVYTVVAAAPAPVLAGVVNSLPHQARPGFWKRMGRGVHRLLSWMDPFR